MTYLLIYLLGAQAFMAYIAYRDYLDVREAFWASLLWPAVLLIGFPAIALSDWLDTSGWRIKFQKPAAGLSAFGFRRSPDWEKSWAIRCPGCELQVWYVPGRDKRALATQGEAT